MVDDHDEDVDIAEVEGIELTLDRIAKVETILNDRYFGTLPGSADKVREAASLLFERGIVDEARIEHEYRRANARVPRHGNAEENLVEHLKQMVM